jgi:hypothetical protein
MAIDRIASPHAAQVGSLLLQGPASQAAKKAQGPERRAEGAGRSAEAMKVELSPVARRGAAERAVTTSNQEAAASTTWFASREGAQAIGALSRR